MHIDKIFPLLIAIAILYFNAKKRSKKKVVAGKPETGGSPEANPSPSRDFAGSIFKSIDELFNLTQPEVQVHDQPKPEAVPLEKKKDGHQPVQEKLIVVEKPTNVENESHETHEDFHFDPRRAVIDAEIINRKYFSILSLNQTHDFWDRHY